MTPLAAPARALLRAVPDSYVRCLRSTDAPVDPALAREQQLAYAAILQAADVEISWLDADEASPDCCFIEDVAVVLGRHAVLTRPGAPSRRREVEPVAPVLARWCAVHRMVAPATLDGGDVLRVGDTLFVGLTERTNAAGATFLAEVASLEGLEVVKVPVHAGLHLKSAITVAAPDLLVAVSGQMDIAPFRERGHNVLVTPEPAGGNVLWLGEQVLVSADAPDTAARLRGRGLDVRILDFSELHKGDGAFTCLSLRLPRPGTWCV